MYQRFLRDALPFLLIVSGLVLGGSSSGGIWANMALQLLALAAMAMVLMEQPARRLSRGLAAILACAVLLPLSQLLPLPPALWTRLPGRAEIAAGYDLVGAALPWLPISLDRDASLSGLVALFPPLAMVLVSAQTSLRGRNLALRGVVAFALGSVLLGCAQRLSGFGTSLQPYDLTNPGMATGLFANRNHLSTLLLAALPCSVLVVRDKAVLGLIAAVLTLGVLLTGSDAGAALLLPTLAASVLYVRPVWAVPRAGAFLLVIAVLALLVAGAWQVRTISSEPPAGGAEQHRPAIIATTLTAARDYLPLGSGGGTFQRIYPRYEDPAKADPEYRNHAHSDYAEVALEYGLPGLLLILASVAWWAQRALVGSGHGPSAANMRGGAVILGVTMAHSLVDYPLRTGAIAMLAGLAVALLDRDGSGEEGDSSHLADGGESGLRISL